MIHDEIVGYDVAKLAKEKGFDVPTFGYYRIDTKDWYRTDVYDDWNDSTIRYSAPTQSLLQRWLREEKGIHIIIDGGFQWGVEDLQRHFMDRDIQVEIGAFGLFDTYEEALHDALLYALQNV